MKNEIAILDATPSKRLFLSIIADYDLNKSMCELVDNALDVWVKGKRASHITVAIVLDVRQQTITVKDDAGGLDESELRYIVGPGQTGTNPTDETIGIFGVGTKRAVVALAQDIRIKTRRGKLATYQVEFDDSWLVEDDNWKLPVYRVDEITAGTTIVELQKLRFQVTEDTVSHLKSHLSAAYAYFLKSGGVTINVNSKPLGPLFFENWAYPRKRPQPPRPVEIHSNTHLGIDTLIPIWYA
jgi:DNA gyrase/topoisomerase IV subunit B